MGRNRDKNTAPPPFSSRAAYDEVVGLEQRRYQDAINKARQKGWTKDRVAAKINMESNHHDAILARLEQRRPMEESQ